MCKYAVVDLEMCKVPRQMRANKKMCAREVIQIGAVLLNEALEVIDKFSTYVSPQFGWIDDEINRLTGIRNEDVIHAPVFSEAFNTFLSWLPTDTKLVSWSNNDEAQIRKELEYKEIEVAGIEDMLDTWIDCQKTFGEKLNSERCYRLSEALVAADIIYEDGAHDGLIDAYNTALLFAKMEREDELSLNPYYRSMLLEEEEACCSTLGSLFGGIDMSAFAVA